MKLRVITALPYLILACSVKSIQLYNRSDNALDLSPGDYNGVILQRLPVDLVFYNELYSSLAVSEYIIVQLCVSKLQLQICNNGMISLELNAQRCQLSLDIPNYKTLIGPFISDVDTKPPGSGKVYYELSNSTSLLARARGEIVQTYRDENFDPTLLIIATYDHVGYFLQKTDNFKVCGGSDSISADKINCCVCACVCVCVCVCVCACACACAWHLCSVTLTRLCWQQMERRRTACFSTARSSGPRGLPGAEQLRIQHKLDLIRETEATSLLRSSVTCRLFQ